MHGSVGATDEIELDKAGVSLRFATRIRKILSDKNNALPQDEYSSFCTMRKTKWLNAIGGELGRRLNNDEFKKFVEALANMPNGGNGYLSVALPLPEISGGTNPEITFHSELLEEAVKRYLAKKASSAGKGV